MRAAPDLFAEQQNALRLLHRLRQHQVRVEKADASTLRAAIIESGLDCVIAWKGENGKPVEYADAYEGVFKEPLVPKARKRAKSCA